MDSKDQHHGSNSGLLQRIVDAVLWFIKDQWFIIGCAIVIVIASQVQVPAEQQQIKQVLVSYISVSVIFFITGCTLDSKILLANYSKWRQHLFIQVQSFLMVSALAFAVVTLAALNQSFMDPWLLIGLIFNGCQPTTMASNVMFTRQSHGNTALTVVETTIGNFLGPFLSPALVKMYLSTHAWYANAVPPQQGGYSALYSRTFKQLGLSMYLPMVVGQIVRYFFPNLVQTIFVKWKLSKLGSFGLLAILWQTFDHTFQTGAIQNAKASNLIFIVFITVVNFAVWLAICVALSVWWLDRKDTVSVAMCVPAKTLALGLPLSFLLFENITSLQEAKIQIPLVIFQVMQMGMASLSTIAFRRWVDAGERKAELSSSTDEIEQRLDQKVDARGGEKV